MSRQTAYRALVRVEKDGAYSNIALDRILSESGLNDRDRRFASELFYGVTERRLLLDYNISCLTDRPPEKISAEVRIILRMGLYQLFFMDSVPDAAAVNETVSLCAANGQKNASGFVNGILRSASRNREIRLPKKNKGKNKYYSVKYSCPERIVRLWRSSYGDELAEGILSAPCGRPPMCARVNTIRTTKDELRASFIEDGIGCEDSPLNENSLLLSSTGAIENLRQYKEGLFHIQDSASQLCCEVLGAGEGMTVLDVCSAPGGKSFTIAEMMNNTGRIVSCDLYASRLNLVKSGAARLGINIIDVLECDASQLSGVPEADRVLCDVPCSGLGIIRRKPELRYKDDTGAETLPEIQYRILCSASEFVKKGGMLVYSTCTLNPAENNDNARRFLAEHDDFEPCPVRTKGAVRRGFEEKENELTLFPQINNTDGFFISLFRRK